MTAMPRRRRVLWFWVLCFAISVGAPLVAVPFADAAGVPAGQVAFVREDHSGGSDTSRDEIWLMNSDGSQAYSLTGYVGSVADLEWSPDGQRIAFAASMPGEAWRVWLIAADGSGKREVPVFLPGSASSNGRLSGIAWSPDGDRLALTRFEWPSDSWSPTSWILVVDVGSGVTETLVGPVTGLAFSRLTWSSRDDSLVVSASTETGESGGLLAYDAATGASAGSLGGGGYFEFWAAPDFSPDGKRVACSVANIAAVVTGQGKSWYSIATGSPGTSASSWKTLARSTTESYACPSWSPDGQWVVASTRPVGGKAHRLVVVPALTRGAPVDTGVKGWLPDWRPTTGPVTRADLLTALTRLRDALTAQYERDLDLTASTCVYTSKYRGLAKQPENLAFWSKKLSECLGVDSTGLGATGKSLKELVSGKVAEDPEMANAFIQGMADGQTSVQYRAAGTAAGINGLIGNVSSAADYDLWPDGYGKLSKAADALRRQYEKQGMDAAITKMNDQIENSGASPFVPLRAAAWTSGMRPKAESWEMAPVQVRSAIRRTFADLAKSIPDPLPAGYEAAAVVSHVKALRRQVLKSGQRRMGFAFVPALSGPNDTTRRISLGMIDANWNCMSRLENAFTKRLEVRKWQSVKSTVDGGLSVLSMMTAGAAGAVATVTEQVNMSAQLVSQEITFPQQTVSPMNAMNENEFEMSMYLVEELANLYEIATCTSNYVKGTLE